VSTSLPPAARRLSWTCQLLAAAILAQTLFFKFTGAAESRWIFQTLGVEPWGRLTAGAVELVCALLLLVPATAALGGLLAAGVMAGAVASHVAVLGVEVQGDGGLLFGLALVTLAASLLVVVLRRDQLAPLRQRLAPARRRPAHPGGP